MNLTKQQKKELRRIYEEKIGKEYVEGLKKQPPYTSSEWLENMLRYSLINVKYFCLYVKNNIHLSKIFYIMKTITLFSIILFSCSIQKISKVLSESDRIIRVYDMNENLLTENITGVSEKSKSDRIIRVYDMNENLLSENIVGQ